MKETKEPRATPSLDDLMMRSFVERGNGEKRLGVKVRKVMSAALNRLS